MNDDHLASLRASCNEVTKNRGRIRRARERLEAEWTRSQPRFSPFPDPRFDPSKKSSLKRIALQVGVGAVAVAALVLLIAFWRPFAGRLNEGSPHGSGFRVANRATQEASTLAGVLPNKALTPGVATSVDATTVCSPGYSKKVRPVGARWRKLKDEAYGRYGIARGHRSYVDEHGVRHAAYEVDHLVPLELGGAPDDLRNLWPQPMGDAKRKDVVEDELHHLVCGHRVPLAQAQAAISRDWRTAAADL
jgi:hypothetical protein